jgi:hypothetical protein
VGVAGCLGQPTDSQSLHYRLSTVRTARSLAELTNKLVLDPSEIRGSFAVDVSDAYKQSVVDTLLDEGTAESVGWSPAYNTQFGTTTRPGPRFFEDDGTYYAAIKTDQTEFTEDRWVFYLDLVDEEPNSSDTVVTEHPTSLSETDQLIVEKALQRVRGHGDAFDVGDYPLQSRGPIFHHGLDPEASDLVPSPPFDYLQLGDRYPQYLVPRAERGPVDLTRYTLGIEEVASSRAELEEHIDATVVEADFDSSDETAVLDIIRTATDLTNSRIYEERGEMSDGLTQIVERLGMSPYIPEDIERTARLHGSVFSFEGEWYDASFTIRRR